MRDDELVGLWRAHREPRRGGTRRLFERTEDIVRDHVFGLELRPLLGDIPGVEDLLHQPREPHERLRALLAERLGAAVARKVAPGADIEVVERVLPGFGALRRDRGETFDLADVATPLVPRLVDVAEA